MKSSLSILPLIFLFFLTSPLLGVPSKSSPCYDLQITSFETSVEHGLLDESTKEISVEWVHLKEFPPGFWGPVKIHIQVNLPPACQKETLQGSFMIFQSTPSPRTIKKIKDSEIKWMDFALFSKEFKSFSSSQIMIEVDLQSLLDKTKLEENSQIILKFLFEIKDKKETLTSSTILRMLQ